MPRHDITNNPVRECSKCGAAHQRKHALCKSCVDEYRLNPGLTRRRAGRKAQEVTCSSAPPPPPGFDERDLTLGRPLC